MSSSLIEQVSAHLEFIGYKVAKDDETTFLATPTAGVESNPIFTITVKEEGLFFLAGFPVSKAVVDDPLGFLRFVNSGNAFSYIARFVFDPEQPSFFVEACYPTIYDKQAFAAFITYWLREMTRFFQRDEELSKKYFENNP